MATKKPRFTITVDDELYAAIEEYRWTHRLESKSDATSELVRIGLEKVLAELEKEGDKK